MKKKQTQTIEINGKRILNSLLKHWTPIAKECYARGCNCQGCNIIPKDSFHEICKIKDYVRGYILKGLYPNGENNDN